MPEGDAVFRTAARLRAALDGRLLTRSDFRVPRYATADLSGRTVLTTVSYGKHLLTRVDGGLTVHTHLRMDGSWWIQPAGRRLPPGDVVRLVLANAEHAGGRRPARRGRADSHGAGGSDRSAISARTCSARTGTPRRPSAACGGGRRRRSGRRYSTSATWPVSGRSGGRRRCSSPGSRPGVRSGECAGLAEMVARTARLMRRAAEEGRGPVTTGDPRPGRELWVYGRDRRPCRRCGTPIARGELGSRPYERLVFYCPACQPW